MKIKYEDMYVQEYAWRGSMVRVFEEGLWYELMKKANLVERLEVPPIGVEQHQKVG